MYPSRHDKLRKNSQDSRRENRCISDVPTLAGAGGWRLSMLSMAPANRTGTRRAQRGHHRGQGEGGCGRVVLLARWILSLLFRA